MCAKNIPEQSYNAQYRTGGEVRCETMSNVIVKENRDVRQRFTQIQKKLCKGWNSAGDS